MTNKLEEVFKELQESHVLVDREEYEQLVEKVKELENEEIKLEVGGYYSDGKRIYKMLKLGAQDNYISSFSFELCCFVKNLSWGINGNFFKGLHKATDKEIKLFKRAEMYHMHGRKLGELKKYDLLKFTNAKFPFSLETDRDIEMWSSGKDNDNIEIYLTVEEQQEAYKKIVGE